jgi:hypothetical protein
MYKCDKLFNLSFKQMDSFESRLDTVQNLINQRDISTLRDIDESILSKDTTRECVR